MIVVMPVKIMGHGVTTCILRMKRARCQHFNITKTQLMIYLTNSFTNIRTSASKVNTAILQRCASIKFVRSQSQFCKIEDEKVIGMHCMHQNFLKSIAIFRKFHDDCIIWETGMELMASQFPTSSWKIEQTRKNS